MEFLLDALIDSLKVWPLLYTIYIGFEWMGSSHTSLFAKKTVSPLIGAIGGCIPQCGVSVIASSLFANRYITMGTLLAVFLSTSDEAIPLMLTYPDQWKMIVRLIVLKVIYATVVGVIIDLCMRQTIRVKSTILSNECPNENCCQQNKSIFKSALNHSIKIVIFLFIMTMLINLIIFFIGEESLSRMLMSNSNIQPFIAALIGLIPNCVSSILLTDLYLKGMISFGSILAGLCTGAGAGLLTLFKLNKSVKQNMQIVMLLYLFGSLIGLVFHRMMIGG